MHSTTYALNPSVSAVDLAPTLCVRLAIYRYIDAYTYIYVGRAPLSDDLSRECAGWCDWWRRVLLVAKEVVVSDEGYSYLRSKESRRVPFKDIHTYVTIYMHTYIYPSITYIYTDPVGQTQRRTQKSI